LLNKITQKHRLEFREEKIHKNTKTPSGILRRLCVGDIGGEGGEASKNT
jgi:hypothetical protein